MRINLILAILIISVGYVQAQVLSIDRGKVEFHTSSIMSDIAAVSKDVDASLDIESGEVNIRIPIKSFDFEYEMMQDHFNEEYMESDAFPHATFTGKINQDVSDIQSSVEVDVIGDLTIHGITKRTQFTATLSKKDDLTRVKCIFPIVFKDFNVDEPSILSKSVAKDVECKAIIYLK